MLKSLVFEHQKLALAFPAQKDTCHYNYTHKSRCDLGNQRRSIPERGRKFISILEDLGDNDLASDLDLATFYFVKRLKMVAQLSMGVNG